MGLGGFLVTLGALFLAGLVADEIGRMTRLPRVTMLLLIGLLAGGAGFDLIPAGVTAWFDALSIVALTMVAFLLGGAITGENLARNGWAIIAISVSVALVTFAVVAAGLVLIGVPLALALILGAVATATDPAAVADVIRQSGREGGFADTLRGIVAVDDIWGILIFSVALVLAAQSDGWSGAVLGAVWDLGGAMALGLVVGVPAAFLTGRLKPGEPLQAEAFGIVFLTAGLALWLEVSFLIAGITCGAVIANLARHHDRAFHEIEHIQWPFMILFFLLAGASLEIGTLMRVGAMGAAFLVLRVLARIVGGLIGARFGGVPRQEAPWYGPALLPQAGVAVGMALVGAERFPDWGATIMAVTIASTVVFEIVGPFATMVALRRAVRINGS